MDTQTWIYLAVGGSFLLYFIIAILSRATRTTAFYVAGGGVGPACSRVF